MNRRDFLKMLGLTGTSTFVFGSGLWKPQQWSADVETNFDQIYMPESITLAAGAFAGLVPQYWNGSEWKDVPDLEAMNPEAGLVKFTMPQDVSNWDDLQLRW